VFAPPTGTIRRCSKSRYPEVTRRLSV